MTAPVRADQDLAALLGQQAGEGATGILTAARGKHKRLFCIERGRLTYAASNVIEEQFAERLVRIGVASPAERAAATREAKRSGTGSLATLFKIADIGEEQAREELQKHLLEMMEETLAWPDGEYRFDAGQPKLDGELTVSIPLVQVVLQRVQRYPARLEDVIVRIGPPDTRPGIGPRASLILDGVHVDGAVQWLLDHADGARTVGELAESAPGKPAATTRAIYGLMLAQVLRASAETAQGAPGTLERVSRDEILGWLLRVEGADYYTVLGLDPSADRDAIRSAYYQLARKMHPDRFRTGDNSDLLDRVERFFTRVTEAYNTLFDPERRKEYDQLSTGDAKKREEEAAKTDPAYVARQNFLRARALAEKRRFTEAVSFLENAIRLDGSQSDYHLELGRLLARNPRRRSEAEEHLQRAAELDPSRVEAYLTLAELHERTGRTAEAAKAYREALRWEPGLQEAAKRLKALGG